MNAINLNMKKPPEYYRQQAIQEKRVREAGDRAARWFGSYPAETAFLRSAAAWSGFCSQMIDAVNRFGSLTPRQLGAVQRMMIEAETRTKSFECRAQPKPVIDLSRINALLATAIASGLKKPKLRIAGLVISMAPRHGNNAGYLYVKNNGDYAGKIAPDGKFLQTRDSSQSVVDKLKQIAADPMSAAALHGRETGQCSCCGRELTDPESVRLGIGPICKEKWGL